jgi:WD40 repeat protein
MKTTLTITIVLLIISLPVFAQKYSNGDTETNILYFGQKPPGKKAEIFAPDLLTIEPHDAPVILEDEELIIVGTMEVGVIFYKMTNGKLSLTTNPLGFDIPEVFQGMAISPSKKRLYIRDWNNGDGFFYFIDKNENGWTHPKSLGDDVNSVDTHWQFTVARNENLYYMARGVGLVVSVFDGNEHLKPVPLKLEDNSNIQAGTPYIAPDESYIIFCKDDDLQISYNLNNGKWTNPKNLGPDINSDALDICPKISPNGKYLFFVSKRTGSDFVTYWADASFIDELKPEQ